MSPNIETPQELALRDKMYGTNSDLFETEQEELLKTIDNYETPTYGEIGVCFGGTFRTILERVRGKDSMCYGFDLFEDLQYETFGENQTHKIYNKFNILNVAYAQGLTDKLNSLNLNKFKLIKGSSEKTVPKIDKVFDMFFIDGNHTYSQTKKDFDCAIRKCQTGSAIAFHNASNDIEPDLRYVKADGGPWKVCEELKKDKRLELAKKTERLIIFNVL